MRRHHEPTTLLPLALPYLGLLAAGATSAVIAIKATITRIRKDRTS
jgi:hypothetical protein